MRKLDELLDYPWVDKSDTEPIYSFAWRTSPTDGRLTAISGSRDDVTRLEPSDPKWQEAVAIVTTAEEKFRVPQA
jgi:hypothetical protein